MKNKGISLIVLVITIIVMIILAAAIIISLNNTGIIDNANKAKNMTDEKTIEELANLAWGEAYASGARSVTDLKDKVEKALNENNVDTNKYGIEVTENGVTIGWKQTADKKVIKGDKVLEIGDVVNYHDAANEDKTENYTGGWQVLGAENGKIKILSNLAVESSVDFLTEDINTKSEVENFYFKYIDTLNEKTKPYATGKGAISSRCITIEDIDSATGYDKSMYKKGTINEYGNTVTYYWDNTSGKESNPYYESTNGVNGNLTSTHTRFNYCLNNQIIENTKPNNLNSKQKITSITNNYYEYKFKDLLDVSKNLDKKVYDMLQYDPTDDEIGYWLASKYQKVDENYASWGIYQGFDNYIYTEGVIYSNVEYKKSVGGIGGIYLGDLRAVVLLSPSVSLTGSSETGWNIN